MGMKARPMGEGRGRAERIQSGDKGRAIVGRGMWLVDPEFQEPVSSPLQNHSIPWSEWHISLNR